MMIKRWNLFFLCLRFNLIISALLITIITIQVSSFDIPSAISIFLQSNSGAFAGVFLPNGIKEPFIWYIGIPNLILLFLHPIKPNKLTGAITMIGFAIWLLIGLSIAYISV